MEGRQYRFDINDFRVRARSLLASIRRGIEVQSFQVFSAGLVGLSSQVTAGDVYPEASEDVAILRVLYDILLPTQTSEEMINNSDFLIQAIANADQGINQRLEEADLELSRQLSEPRQAPAPQPSPAERQERALRFFERFVPERRAQNDLPNLDNREAAIAFIKGFKITQDTSAEDCTHYMKAVMRYRNNYSTYNMALIQEVARRSAQAAVYFCGSRFCQEGNTPDSRTVLAIVLAHRETPQFAHMLINLQKTRPEVARLVAQVDQGADAIPEKKVVVEDQEKKAELKEEKKEEKQEEKKEESAVPRLPMDEDDIFDPITMETIRPENAVKVVKIEGEGQEQKRRILYFDRNALDALFQDKQKKFEAAQNDKRRKDPAYEVQPWNGLITNPRAHFPINRAMLKDVKDDAVFLAAIEEHDKEKGPEQDPKSPKPPGK